MKIQIVSIPRSGSAYLTKLISKKLELSTKTYSTSEIFNPLKQYNIENVLNNIKEYNSVITKNQISHLLTTQQTTPDIYLQFKKIEWFTVLLLRKDIFENTLSRCIAHLTGDWNNYNYTTESFIEIDVDYFISSLQETMAYWKVVKENLLEIEYNRVLYYEDLTFDPNIDFNHLNIFKEERNIQIFSAKSPSKYKIVKNVFELKEISNNLTSMLDFQNIESVPYKEK